MQTPISRYLENIRKELKTAGSTEHTFRPALKGLIEELNSDIVAKNEPSHVQCGAPDYAIYSKGYLIGYVEAKDLGKDLERESKTDQLKRYRGSLHSLILTNYLEFVWYVDGLVRGSATLAVVESNKVNPIPGGEEKVLSILAEYLSYAPLRINSSLELSSRMARLTDMMQDAIVQSFNSNKPSQDLIDLRKAVAESLMPDIIEEGRTRDFADMYAQTICFGLFAARLNHMDPSLPFQRQNAAREIPKTNPFLRKLFEIITGTAIDSEPYVNYVDDLVTLLSNANIDKIIDEFRRDGGRKDPLMHFYETYLVTYDPLLRKKRGVYYTDESIVSYIVHSVDELLISGFSLPDGLADTSMITYPIKVKTDDSGNVLEKEIDVQKISHKVIILDPACGTGTFLYSVVDHIRSRFIEAQNAGLWSGYVKNHLLPRIIGFELLMAPYSVAHLKLAMELAGKDLPKDIQNQWNYDFSSDERLGIFLTNTLDNPEKSWSQLFGPFRILTDESRQASQIKKDLPILVVLGNPPYSGNSSNKHYDIINGKQKPNFIGRLIHDYFIFNGEPINERQPKWLYNDYVKFIRWGQWRIQKTNAGVLAFITDHSYLDNPTFRGMRQSLVNSFNEIYILDLHGNSKKKEKSPDGSNDENVFGIEQGVAIGIFVKRPGIEGPAKVYYSELWGKRGDKFVYLSHNSLASTNWCEIDLNETYCFRPSSKTNKDEYDAGWKLDDIFQIKSAGILSANDKISIQKSKDDLWAIVQSIASLSSDEVIARYSLKNTSNWQIKKVQADIINSGPKTEKIHRIMYRPFDFRFTYYTGKSGGFICRPGGEAMQNMLSGNNIALIAPKRVEVQGPWRHVFVSKQIIDHVALSNKTIDTLFPLYLDTNSVTGIQSNDKIIKKETIQQRLSHLNVANGRIPNLNENFIEEIRVMTGLTFVMEGHGDLSNTFGPEDVLGYIYSILNTPSYKVRYEQFLKAEYPRIPVRLPNGGRESFSEICKIGIELITLHTLQFDKSKINVRYPNNGSNVIEDKYPIFQLTEDESKQGKIWINEKQYFEPVNQSIWDYELGGYQVCQKWLLDRRGQALSYDDLSHYMATVYSLEAAMELIPELNRLWNDVLNE